MERAKDSKNNTACPVLQIVIIDLGIKSHHKEMANSLSLTIAGLGVGVITAAAGLVSAGYAVKEGVKKRSAKKQSFIVSAAEASQSSIQLSLVHFQQQNQYQYQQPYPHPQLSFPP